MSLLLYVIARTYYIISNPENFKNQIYVNPEGPMGEPNVAEAAEVVREVFGRMDWTGRELVAFIGGGHTFGKAHGASTASNGDPPNVCPFASWDGPIGTAAITSGIEGPWTSDPTKWSNEYFQSLLNFEWEPTKGPGGKWQFKVKGDNGPTAPSADPKNTLVRENVMMLTTDIALTSDPEYRLYVEEFASNLTAFTEAFGEAWYKLTTRDMGPHSRCAGTVSRYHSLTMSLLVLLQSFSLPVKPIFTK
jgi:catalase-peroxidase